MAKNKYSKKIAKMVPITVQVPPELRNRIREKAEEIGVKDSTYIRMLLTKECS